MHMHMHTPRALRRWAVLLAGLAAQAAAQAITVNIDASSSKGVTLLLDPGSYTVNYIGTGQGGAYDGWNLWGSGVINACDAKGQNCSQGYTDAYAITIGSTQTQYTMTNPFFASPIDALAGFQAGPLVQSINSAPGIPLLTPMGFTLSAPTSVSFLIVDTLYADNFGGVSLSVSAVPEPASAGLFAAGMAGLAMWRRRRVAGAL